MLRRSRSFGKAGISGEYSNYVISWIRWMGKCN
jgi:hypothetical protein